MELKEMIKVMQHYEDGGDIEFSNDNFETELGEANKEDDGDLCWNWDEFDYRIKEQKEKLIIEKWLCLSGQEFVIIETSDIDAYTYITKKVKLLESYEIEL